MDKGVGMLDDANNLHIGEFDGDELDFFEERLRLNALASANDSRDRLYDKAQARNSDGTDNADLLLEPAETSFIDSIYQLLTNPNWSLAAAATIFIGVLVTLNSVSTNDKLLVDQVYIISQASEETSLLIARDDRVIFSIDAGPLAEGLVDLNIKRAETVFLNISGIKADNEMLVSLILPGLKAGEYELILSSQSDSNKKVVRQVFTIVP